MMSDPAGRPGPHGHEQGHQHGHHLGDAITDEVDEATADAFWRANVRLVAWLLAVWFVVSFGFGILLVEPLNAVDLFGFKLGFWFAQQGAIYVFVALIFVYAWAMVRLERRHGVRHDRP